MPEPTATSSFFPIIPLGAKLILSEIVEEETKSGILLTAANQQSRVAKGRIVAGSLDTCPSCKTLYYPAYGVGTVVLFVKAAGELLTVDAASYLLIPTDAVLAIVPASAPSDPPAEAA